MLNKFTQFKRKLALILYCKKKNIKNDFDFVDFGSKSGGSMDYAIKHLGGIKGLGIDIRSDIVGEARKNGHNLLVGDATKLDIPDKAVKFTVLSHFLEHLPNIKSVDLAISNALRISTDFIYIQGPCFDDDEYLKRKGLITFWSNWTGHPCHLTTEQLTAILKTYEVKDIKLELKKPIQDSDDVCIHSLNSPIDQHDYDPKVHPPKPSLIKFNKDIYREFSCYVSI